MAAAGSPALHSSESSLRFQIGGGATSKSPRQSFVLSNPSARAAAFKVKTTSPKIYCVKPNCTVLPPGGAATIEVTLAGDKVERKAKNKDKFLVQAAWMAEGASEAEITEKLKGCPTKGDPSADSDFWFTKIASKVSWPSLASTTIAEGEEDEDEDEQQGGLDINAILAPAGPNLSPRARSPSCEFEGSGSSFTAKPLPTRASMASSAQTVAALRSHPASEKEELKQQLAETRSKAAKVEAEIRKVRQRQRSWQPAGGGGAVGASLLSVLLAMVVSFAYGWYM